MKTVHQADGLLLVGVSRRTDIELVLSEPTVLQTHDGERTADRVGFWVDDPRAFVGLLQSQDATPA
ncbi:MAG: hypothetical protein L0H26_08390 [Microlunatus sp.]|nr:hypothetical protein [Microlunatus sp.]